MAQAMDKRQEKRAKKEEKKRQKAVKKLTKEQRKADKAGKQQDRIIKRVHKMIERCDRLENPAAIGNNNKKGRKGRKGKNKKKGKKGNKTTVSILSEAIRSLNISFSDEKTRLNGVLALEESELNRKSTKTELKSIQLSIKSKLLQIRNKKKEIQASQKAIKLAAKAERKRIKEEKKAKLDAARLLHLPLNVSNNELIIFVDGYNIIGCDSIARKNMRKRKTGLARKRIAALLNDNICNNVNLLSKLGYNIKLNLWFDHKGKDYNLDDMTIHFSGKQIVDDALVEKFENSNDNSNIIVVTSDKEFTIRLHECGVKVIKSGVFYKLYLKAEEEEVAIDNNGNNNEDEMKEIEIEETEEETIEAGETFTEEEYEFLTNKINNDSNEGNAPDLAESDNSYSEGDSNNGNNITDEGLEFDDDNLLDDDIFDSE